MNKRIVRGLWSAMACLLMLALLAPAALASSVAVRINAATKVYQSPSKTAKSVSVQSGLTVTLKSSSDGWGRVAYKGKTGYIPLKYLTLVEPIRAYASEKATVYKSAGSGRLGTVEKGTALWVIGVDGKYARIQNQTGSAQGYIRASSLSRTMPDGDGGDGSASLSAVPAKLQSDTDSPSESKIEYTVYVAQSLIGAPYAEHASPPGSFDCAGFVRYCYDKAQSGAIKSSSRAQGYDDRYERVDSLTELKRGDLVCFNTEDDDDLSDHVGIYLGSGYFIHASAAAKEVIVSQLTSGYYHRAFSWARRIFEE